METDLTALTSILQIEPDKRPFNSILKLISATSEIQFFKELTQKASGNAHFLCCQYMKYQFYTAGATVFYYGELGTQFYILLQGCLAVKTIAEDESEFTEILRLSSGAFFGELALEQNKLRSATIECLEDCHLAVLDKSDYKRILLNFVKEKQIELVVFLQSLPLFSKCTKETIRKLTFFFIERVFTKNQIVYREGDTAETVYIIRSGEFKFSKKLVILKSQSAKLIGRQILADKRRRNEVSKAHIVILGNGEIFGEDEVIKNCSRDMTCMCMSYEACVLVIMKEDFLNRIKSEESWNYVKQRLALKDINKHARLKIAHKMQVQAVSSSSHNLSATLKPVQSRPIPFPFQQRTDLVSHNHDRIKSSLLFKSVQKEMSQRGPTSYLLPISRTLSSSRSSSAIPKSIDRNKLSCQRNSIYNMDWSKSAENIMFLSKGCAQFRNTPPPSPGRYQFIDEEETTGMSIVSLNVRPRTRKTVYL